MSAVDNRVTVLLKYEAVVIVITFFKIPDCGPKTAPTGVVNNELSVVLELELSTIFEFKERVVACL